MILLFSTIKYYLRRKTSILHGIFLMIAILYKFIYFQRFVRSWDITGTCRRNNRPISHNSPAISTTQDCISNLYHDLDIYKSCDGAVNSQYYLEMCQENNLPNGNTSQDAYCAPFLSYFAKCQAARINVPVPHVCRKWHSFFKIAYSLSMSMFFLMN